MSWNTRAEKKIERSTNNFKVYFTNDRYICELDCNIQYHQMQVNKVFHLRKADSICLPVMMNRLYSQVGSLIWTSIAVQEHSRPNVKLWMFIATQVHTRLQRLLLLKLIPGQKLNSEGLPVLKFTLDTRWTHIYNS